MSIDAIGTVRSSAQPRVGVIATLMRERARLADAEGFVIPMAIFAIVIMSVVAVTALFTGTLEQRSSRAVRESVFALYAAEAGLNEVWAEWDDSLVQNLNPGDSVDLGWTTLDNGASYRAKVHRVDNGGQQIYSLIAEGRGAGALRGQRMISYALSKSKPDPICCVAAAQGGANGGQAIIKDGVTVSGIDTDPPEWGGGCFALEDKPGLIWNDTSKVETEPTAVINGDPPLVEDTTIANNSYDLGPFDYDSLVALANVLISGDVFGAAPVEVPGLGTCDTSVNTNWGAPTNPSHVCANYFPVIYAAGPMTIKAESVGQGILIVDGELTLDAGFTFYGLIISKQEFQLKGNATIYGSIMTGAEVQTEPGDLVQYSGCALGLSLANAGLTNTERLWSRSWGEILR